MIRGINEELDDINIPKIKLIELRDELVDFGDTVEMFKDRNGEDILFGCREGWKAIWWEN